MESDNSPRIALDQSRREIVLALLGNGCSRRTAARYIGCATATITRTANRDPQFGEQIARAEQNAEIDALRCIRSAAKNERYWRAAAWLLERKNPTDFTLRPPTMFTIDQVADLFAKVTDVLAEDLPEENRQRALQKLERLMVQCRAANSERSRCQVTQCPPLAPANQQRATCERLPSVDHPVGAATEIPNRETQPPKGASDDNP